MKKTSTRYMDRHPLRRKLVLRKMLLKIKEKVFAHYGKVCVGCGFSDMRALNLDHVLDDGYKHRAQKSMRGGYTYWNWFVKNNFPKGFQVLCSNCNQIKEYNKRCAVVDRTLRNVEVHQGGSLKHLP